MIDIRKFRDANGNPIVACNWASGAQMVEARRMLKIETQARAAQETLWRLEARWDRKCERLAKLDVEVDYRFRDLLA